MGLPELSLIALAIAVVVAVVRNVNVGPLSLAVALVVGYYIGGVKIKDIIAGYPVNVFLMLAGITYLFAIANINGTLQKLTQFAVKGVGGNVALLPIALFILAFALSSLGPGAITICAFAGSANDAVGLASENTGFFDGFDGSQWRTSRQYVAYSRRWGHRERAGAENEPA